MKKQLYLFMFILCAVSIAFGEQSDDAQKQNVVPEKTIILQQSSTSSTTDNERANKNIVHQESFQKDTELKEKNDDAVDQTKTSTQPVNKIDSQSNHVSGNDKSSDKTTTIDITDNTLSQEPVVVYIPEDDIKNVSTHRTVPGTTADYSAKIVSPWVSYGAFVPVADYSNRYYGSSAFSAGARLPYIAKWGITPGLYSRFMNLSSKSRDGYSDASLSLAQLSIGISYSYSLSLASVVPFISRPLTVQAGLSEGITRVAYTADDAGKSIEYINTIEATVRLSYPVIYQMELGIEAGYRTLFTAGSPLQGYVLQLVCGVRL